MTKEEILRRFTYQQRLDEVWHSTKKALQRMALTCVVCLIFRYITGLWWVLIPSWVMTLLTYGVLIRHHGLRKQFEAQQWTVERLDAESVTIPWTDPFSLGTDHEGRQLYAFVVPKKR